MDIQEVKRRKKEKKVGMYIKVSESQSAWMSENEISPTLLFHTALSELKEKNENAKRNRRVKRTS